MISPTMFTPTMIFPTAIIPKERNPFGPDKPARSTFFSSTRHLLVTAMLLTLCACSPAVKRDMALYEDNWNAWCELNNKQAHEGSSLAMNNLATCYEEGLGGYVVDKQKALHWYRMAALSGNATAKMNLARLPRESLAAKDKQLALAPHPLAPHLDESSETETARASLKREDS